MWKDVKAILLPTKEKSNLILEESHLVYCKEPRLAVINGAYNQELYVISLDEEIKEREYYIAANMIFLSDEKYNSDDSNNPNGRGYYKVLASTDISLQYAIDKSPYPMEVYGLPQIPQQFIEEWIVEYNKRVKVEDLEVEYDLFWNNKRFKEQPFPDEYATEKDRVYKLKISKDNFISIRRKEKRRYTREEVIDFADGFRYYLEERYGYSLGLLDEQDLEWIQQNL